MADFAGGSGLSEKEPIFGDQDTIGNEKGQNKPKIKQNMYGNTFNGISLGESIEQSGENNDFAPDIDGESIEGMQKLYEHPDFPLLKNMRLKGLITTSELDTIFEAFNKIGNLEQAINTLEDKNKVKNIISVINYSKREYAKKTNKINFQKDFQEEIGNVDDRSPKELSILDLLGENYIVIFSKLGGKVDSKIDINATFNRTINSYIDGKVIKRNENFELLLNNTKNPDFTFEERFKSLKEIIILIDTEQGKEGKASKDKLKKMKGEENIEKQSLESRFNDLQKRANESLSTNKNIEKLELLKQKIIEMKEEADSEGDIFVSSDLEKLQGEIESVLKENA